MKLVLDCCVGESLGLQRESVGEGEVQFPLVPSLLVRVPLDWNAQTFQGSLLTRQQ